MERSKPGGSEERNLPRDNPHANQTSGFPLNRLAQETTHSAAACPQHGCCRPPPTSPPPVPPPVPAWLLPPRLQRRRPSQGRPPDQRAPCSRMPAHLHAVPSDAPFPGHALSPTVLHSALLAISHFLAGALNGGHWASVHVQFEPHVTCSVECERCI
jgi:hypothetical protein